MLSIALTETTRPKPGPSNAAPDLKGIAETIKENWRKSVEGILKLTKECAKARNQLTESQKKELYKLLPFNESMFSKLASIGDDLRLRNHQDLLPASISTLYELSQLPDERFESVLKEGLLKPDLKRQELTNWKANKAPLAPSQAASEEGSLTPSPVKFEVRLPPVLICLYSEAPIPEEQRPRVKATAIELADQLGMKVTTLYGATVDDFKYQWRKPKPTPT